MALSSGVSISNSVVYRSLQGHQGKVFSSKSTRITDPLSSSDSLSEKRWTFLHRLLAIEKAHDKKRQAAMRQSNSQEEISDLVPLAKPTIDTQHRWTYGQVLDDLSEGGRTPDQGEAVSGLPLITSRDRLNSPYLKAPVTGKDKECNGLPRLADSNSFTASTPTHRTVSPSQESLRHSSFNTQQTEGSRTSAKPRRSRHLRLPPILLPRVYTMKPRPLHYREFLTPTKVRGPITEAEWDELKDCRYIRHAVPPYGLPLSPSKLDFL